MKRLFWGLLLVLLSGSITLFSAAINEGLQLHYTFDEGKGNTVRDLSENHNDGKVSQACKWVKMTDPFEVQHFGFALQMTGIVDGGRRPSLAISGTNLTLEAWLKTAEENKAYDVLSNFTADWKTFHRGYGLSVIKGNQVRVWLGFGTTAKAFESNFILQPDTFYHIIATYDGKLVKIYVNGLVTASIPESRPIVSDPKDNLYLGNFGAANHHLIDQIKIFNRLLNADEINQEFDNDKAQNQYKSLAANKISVSSSPNLLINSSFARCANPGIPDWWGTNMMTTIKDWNGVYGIDDAITPPVAKVKCLKINKPFVKEIPHGFWLGSTFTCLPGNKDYTFSVYLKASTTGMTVQIDGGISSTKAWKAPVKYDLTTEWQRYTVSGHREGDSPMASINITINGQGTAWVAAPQLECGLKATPYQLADSETVTADTQADLAKINMVFAENPPVIDGKLDDAVWANTPKLDNFQRNELPSVKAEVNTEAYLAYDDKNLYIAFRCFEPNMDKIKAAATTRDNNNIFTDDLVEVFLSTTPEANDYYQLGVNTLGAQFDAYNRINSWDPSWKCAIAQKQDSWTVEIAIPFSAFERSALDAIWRINLCRTRYAGKNVEYSSFSPIKGFSFHTTSRFAWLLGLKKDIVAGKPAKKKIERPRLNVICEYDFYTSDEFAALIIDSNFDHPVDLTIELKDSNTGKFIETSTQHFKIDAVFNQRIPLTISNLRDGQYEVVTKVMDKDKLLITSTDKFRKLPAGAVDVRTNKVGRYLAVNGKPFWGYGTAFYLKWLRYGKTQDANWQLDDLKNHGFNSMWSGDLTDFGNKSAEYQYFLDECQGKGIKVIFQIEINRTLPYDKRKADTLEIVNKFKNHPAILAWNFVDEPDLWWDKSGDKKERDLLDIYQAIKTADPYRPAFINWCHFSNNPFGGTDATDIVSVDRYPLRWDMLTFKPGLILDIVEAINQVAGRKNLPSMLFLQLQGYWDMSREPTPSEVRWMSYVSFIQGTRILQYFTYRPMSEQLWQSMLPLGQELQELFTFVSAPDSRELIITREGQLAYTIWQSGNEYYLIFASTATRPVAADIDFKELTGKMIKTITPLFETSGAKKSENILSFSLTPLQCGSYKILCQ